MKYIIIADIHLSAFSNEKIIENIPEKLYYNMKTLENMIVYANEHNISNVIIAGDTMHTKSIIHSVAQSMLLDWIRMNRMITFNIISGNHDMSSKSGTGVSALKCLDSESNVRLFHESQEYEKFYYVPWDPNKMISDIKGGPKNKILITHLGVTEAKLNSGISIVSDIKLSDFNGYPVCFLGHYHKPQQIKNVWYVGSCTILDFGEKDDIKRFLVFDDETGEIESVPTIGYKKYLDYVVSADTDIKEMLVAAKHEKDRGNEVRIIQTAPIDMTQFRIEDFKIVDRREQDYKSRGITSSMSNEEKMKKYLELKDIPEDSFPEYIKIGIEIISGFGGGESN